MTLGKQATDKVECYQRYRAYQDDWLLKRDEHGRFIGKDLFTANSSFRTAVEDMVNVMAPSANYTATYRPGVMAPIYGPDGLNGSRKAYAPTPGQGVPPTNLTPGKNTTNMMLIKLHVEHSLKKRVTKAFVPFAHKQLSNAVP